MAKDYIIATELWIGIQKIQIEQDKESFEANEKQIKLLILISYSIAFILFIISLIFEKRITILDLIIAVVILAVPFLNVIMFSCNCFKLITINNKKLIENIVNLLNTRIK